MGTFCTKSVWDGPSQTLWIHPSFAVSFNHLVGAQLEFTADRKPKRLRSLEIDERGQLCPIAIAGIVAASSALMNICYGGRVMAMKIDRIQPAGMNVRIQQGKPAYSHVVTVTGP